MRCFPARPPAPHSMRILFALLSIPALAAPGVVSRAALREPTVNPHGAFKEDCSQCHGATAWKPAKISAKFDHSKYGFKLDGAHASASCLGCHSSLEFKQSRTRCASCHEDVHRGEMGADCARCHNARSFIDRAPMARAHQLTRFPLSGAHAALDCESCHPAAAQGHLQFVGTRADCSGCHMAQYRATTTPDHEAGRYPLACETCHSAIGWNRARFDHSRTQFPLTGAHRTTACRSCHGDNVYRGKSAACASCHQTNYDGTTNPPHAAAAFPATCANCHNTTNWQSSSFDHSATSFPLTGAHVALACQRCHGDGVYQGKSTACVSCHQADYDATTNPGHAAAAFSTTCGSCHGTTTWLGAAFNHDGLYFPIYSGVHRGKWASCATCHTSATRYSVFTCFSCHPHDDKPGTDGHHSGVSGYSYTSQACYSCHPRGTR